MPKDATTTRSDMAAATLSQRATIAGGNVMHIALIFDGVAANPEDVFDALVTKFGSGKVTSDRDTAARNMFQLRIKP